MSLTNKQKQFLKGEAHPLKPVVLLGANGLTEGVIAEIEQALAPTPKQGKTSSRIEIVNLRSMLLFTSQQLGDCEGDDFGGFRKVTEVDKVAPGLLEDRQQRSGVPDVHLRVDHRVVAPESRRCNPARSARP